MSAPRTTSKLLPLALLLGALGCARTDAPPLPPAPAPGGPPAHAGAPPPLLAPPPGREAPPPPPPLTAGAAQSAPALPDLAGARELAGGDAPPAGVQARRTYCLDGGGLPSQVAQAVRAQLEAEGWERITVAPHPKAPDRIVGITARRGGYVLGGSAQRGEFTHCSGERGSTYVPLALFLQQPEGSVP